MFKEKMLTSIIPSVETMISKEINHLNFLIISREKMIKRSKNFLSFLYPYYKEDSFNIEECISRSKLNLEHLNMRLIEYREYANNL